MTAIIFDYDGVLIYSRELWVSAFKEIAKQFGKEKSEEEILPELGPKTSKVIENLIGTENTAKGKEIVDNYMSTINKFDKIKVIPNAKEILQKLKENGHTLFLLTNANNAFVSSSMEHFEFDKTVFDRIITANDIYLTKSEAIKDIAETNGINIQDIYYIGDMERDIQVAKDAGCKSVILEGNYGFEYDLKIERDHPDFSIKSLNELLEIIK